MANDSRCGRQAVLLSTWHLRARRFPGYESRSSPYRVNHPLVPLGPSLSRRPEILGNRLSKHLPASGYPPFIVELFTSPDLLVYSKDVTPPTRPLARLVAPDAGQR